MGPWIVCIFRVNFIYRNDQEELTRFACFGGFGLLKAHLQRVHKMPVHATKRADSLHTLLNLSTDMTMHC